MAFRAFIAVDLPANATLETVARELRTSGAALKLADVRGLHLTLKFLGDTDEGRVPEVMAVLRQATAGLAPFRIRLRGMGAFPGVTRMNVVWVGVRDAEPLTRVAGILDEGLEALGFPREGRPWSPHATLARVKGGRNLDRVRQILQAHGDDDFGDLDVSRIVLKRSVLGPSGAEYSDVGAVDLVGP